MADDANIKNHESTYAGLISLMKWGAAGVAVIAALVIWIISK